MDEEIFSDLCVIESSRYTEIKSVFLKYELIKVDEQGRIVIVNWAKYQQSESAERVRRYRDANRSSQGNAPVTDGNGGVTPCNGDETEMKRSEGEGEEEGEGEIEGEGERAGAEPPAPAVTVPEVQEQRALEEVVADWFAGLKRETWVDARPTGKDYENARALLRATRGDVALAKRMRAEYFTHWRDLWFACAKADKDKPADKRAPDFDFRAYCANAVTLAARVKSAEAQAARPKGGRAIPAEPPPSPEERAAAAALLAEGLSGSLAARVGAAS